MVKLSKANPIPEKSKKVEAPAIIHRNLADLTQRAYEKGMMKYNRVEIASSPYLTTPEYLNNYGDIFGHE